MATSTSNRCWHLGSYIAYIVTKAGGYPPYQDSVNDYNIKLGPEPDDTWPFPKDKP